MKNRYIRRKRSGSDKLLVLQAALPAKANRAYIPAAITFDTFLKFIHPSRQSFRLIILLKALGTIGIVHSHLLLENSRSFRIQIRTIPMFFEIGGAAVHVDCFDLVRV
jgi:hypothetical protein